MSGIVIEDATVVIAKILDAYAAFLLCSIANNVPIVAVGHETDNIIDINTTSLHGINRRTKKIIIGKINSFRTETTIARKSLSVPKSEFWAIITPAIVIGKGVFIAAI